MDFHFNNLLFRIGNPLNLKISKVQSEILKFTKLKISKIKMDWILWLKYRKKVRFIKEKISAESF